MNEDANISTFLRMFQPPFPVGKVAPMDAMEYMQISMVVRTFYPYVAFIDRKGMIRYQLTGVDLPDEKQQSVLHEIAEKLVDEPVTPPKSKRSSH